MKTTPEPQALIRQIQKLKQKAHDKLSLYIDLSAPDLSEQLNLPAKSITTLQKVMKESMLEGDQILSKAKSPKGLTIRYYVDNLSSSRKKAAHSKNQSKAVEIENPVSA